MFHCFLLCFCCIGACVDFWILRCNFLMLNKLLSRKFFGAEKQTLGMGSK